MEEIKTISFAEDEMKHIPQQLEEFSFPAILELNVGGSNFTTSLSTMRKYKSMFSSMFSGKFEVVKDANGRYFIDRDPEVFCHILDFMRSDALPPRCHFLKVYNEALYLSFDYLIEKLSVTQPVAGKLVRDCFLRGSLKYSQKFDELIRLAKEMALAQGGARKSKMKIAVFKDKAENMTEHRSTALWKTSEALATPIQKHIALESVMNHFLRKISVTVAEASIQ
ncbi:Oidioi.mRNA.OKI2018_I69.chr1.g3009.t1.cds [Oikopleura dioica]|uniref:Oidioi.mRNA.OKI2018_I69.chr1.g3009.t1.cds n=1 Tax=Oikopleura dioica TaxID=34765 RepID=A0ABN7SUK0_OIKDI|nr:Oidioi.mRNA.OKI2018_I69.chr1.g3009.t1.cds [Oikopleura dioica]